MKEYLNGRLIIDGPTEACEDWAFENIKKGLKKNIKNRILKKKAKRVEKGVLWTTDCGVADVTASVRKRGGKA